MSLVFMFFVITIGFYIVYLSGLMEPQRLERIFLSVVISVLFSYPFKILLSILGMQYLLPVVSGVYGCIVMTVLSLYNSKDLPSVLSYVLSFTLIFIFGWLIMIVFPALQGVILLFGTLHTAELYTESKVNMSEGWKSINLSMEQSNEQTAGQSGGSRRIPPRVAASNTILPDNTVPEYSGWTVESLISGVDSGERNKISSAYATDSEKKEEVAKLQRVHDHEFVLIRRDKESLARTMNEIPSIMRLCLDNPYNTRLTDRLNGKYQYLGKMINQLEPRCDAYTKLRERIKLSDYAEKINFGQSKLESDVPVVIARAKTEIMKGHIPWVTPVDSSASSINKYLQE